MTIYAARGPKRLSPLVTFGVTVIFALSLFHFEFKLTIVMGESMLPTLKPGDVLLVDRRAYVNSQPRRGDVVVARYQKGLVVKRIVGLPGEQVEVKNGALFIDGVLEKENYLLEQGPLNIAKGKLLDGYFATLGDNRAVPTVLAIHPILLQSEIVGKVIFSETLLPSFAKSGKP
jgi:signal peptidase I